LKTGISFSGGAGYGFALVGALKVLEKNAVLADMVSGTSVGAMIGSMYASGMTAAEIEKAVLEFKWQDISTGLSLKGDGLINLDKIGQYAEKHTKVKNIEELKRKMYIAAVDMTTGKEKIFDSGPLGTVIRASCSLPGIFTPVAMENTIYMDGGLLNNMPTNALKQAGADFIIGIDVISNNHTDMFKHKDVFSVLWRSWQISIEAHMKMKDEQADIVIMPEIRNINAFDITKKHELLKAGEEAAEAVMPQLLEKMKAKQGLFGKIKDIIMGS